MCNGQNHDHARDNTPGWLANLRQPMPLGRKVRLILRNNWIKVKKRQDCCGNYGEPGC